MNEPTKQILLPQTPDGRRRVAIYARVGNSNNVNEIALTVQLLRCFSLFEQRRDWELAGIYTDCGYSGLTDERPGFKRLMLDCYSGQYDMILSFSICRLSRRTILLLDTLHELERAKVDVFFVKENLYTSSSKGKMLYQICAVLAAPDPYEEEINADYSDQSSEGSDAAQA